MPSLLKLSQTTLKPAGHILASPESHALRRSQKDAHCQAWLYTHSRKYTIRRTVTELLAKEIRSAIKSAEGASRHASRAYRAREEKRTQTLQTGTAWVQPQTRILSMPMPDELDKGGQQQ
jgi:hypothetical protein